ncbi:MAG TPA: TetR/AcrR family transcriptional regulator [Ktedonobacteraceae bacterium]|nr:TetR/AcrR family transcriptional regulator [Ktedonobacteraceae bacterium]
MNTKTKYYSPLRQSQAAATRMRILEACASVMETGADLTFSNVAEAAGVQERTVYRHFPTKADLEAGLWGWITENLTHADFGAKNEDELVAAMRTSFIGFDKGAPLIQAMLHSRQGEEIRISQQEKRRVMFEACVEDAVPEAPPQIRTRAAAAVQVLYSAASWDFLRTFWGMDATQAADAVELAIRSLLTGLQTGTWQQDHSLTRPQLEDRNQDFSNTRPQNEGTTFDFKGGSHE